VTVCTTSASAGRWNGCWPTRKKRTGASAAGSASVRRPSGAHGATARLLGAFAARERQHHHVGRPRQKRVAGGRGLRRGGYMGVGTVCFSG
jgi:hypothetical protein